VARTLALAASSQEVGWRIVELRKQARGVMK
jgi:hypothetical protein